MADRWPVRVPVGMRDCFGMPLASVWCFRPSDPWAITVEFADDAGTTRWTFARQLLAVGLRMPAGMCDVQVWPTHRFLTRRIVLRLCSPDGETTLTGPAADLERFLAITHGWVAEGDEPRYVDVDAAAARLLEAGQC